MTTFYAQPYSIEHTGFYFDDLEAFETGMERLNRRGCEEVEIQFIDGDSHLATLARAADIGQCQVDLWYDRIDDLDETEAQQLLFLLDCGYDLDNALDRYDEVCLYDGTASDYVAELVEECYEVPDGLRFYIDHDAMARDMKINGEIAEIRYDRIVTNALDF